MFTLEFESNDSDREKYKVKTIYISAIFIMESRSGNFLGLYYLVS